MKTFIINSMAGFVIGLMGGIGAVLGQKIIEAIEMRNERIEQDRMNQILDEQGV